ncbi:GMC family oxidoreductase [Sphingopyxis sp.]|uniref:GMC family oxidoreductase n=1 Tax=Sphingopyxis sp. TaxID=1908224 RepID=UPI003BACA356
MTAAAPHYVIVGAGAAGCVLAERLTADGTTRVTLLEAGGEARHPFFQIPKAVGKLAMRPASLWAHRTKAEASTGDKVESWRRGKALGGSTAINGLVYVRGQPSDFDSFAELGGSDWGWDHIGPAYEAIERHEMGAGDGRGTKGPLRISLPGSDVRMRWHERILETGRAFGLSEKDDINAPDDMPAVGYCPRTIAKGRRQSAATAFLRPARRRPNLTVITGATVDRILFDGIRATGVAFVHRGQRRELAARAEIIIAGGALSSPGILERSGIGDPERLAHLGIDLVAANLQVGENLLEHRALLMQWRMASEADSYNRSHRGLGLIASGIRYMFGGRGPLGSATFDMGAWLKSRPELNRPDVQFLIAPHSMDRTAGKPTTESFPGMSMVVYPLRPNSAGSVHIDSRDPAALPVIAPNHRSSESDRREMIAAVRAARRFVAMAPLAAHVAEETLPGTAFETDNEILAAYDRFATCGYHAVGSCRMGKDDRSVVDPKLRVRGVEGLRVVDTSVMPVVPSGNTQGPTMAFAWRAAEVIASSKQERSGR